MTDSSTRPAGHGQEAPERQYRNLFGEEVEPPTISPIERRAQLGEFETESEGDVKVEATYEINIEIHFQKRGKTEDEMLQKALRHAKSMALSDLEDGAHSVTCDDSYSASVESTEEALVNESLDGQVRRQFIQ